MGGVSGELRQTPYSRICLRGFPLGSVGAREHGDVEFYALLVRTQRRRLEPERLHIRLVSTCVLGSGLDGV